MILVALLFIAVGVADLVRERFRRPIGPLVGLIVASASALLIAWGLGIPQWWTIAVLGVTLTWVSATALPSTGQSGYVKLAILGIPTAAAWGFSPVRLPSDSPIARWYESLPYDFTDATDVTTFALGVGGVLLLLETANIVVRLVLAAAPRGERPVPASAPPAKRSWFGRDAAVAVSPAPSDDPPLKGGRIIGPFERVFLLALVLAGQFTALAAVVAAKGIIRFPEISRDNANGSKAEYFLVGSFASWAVVLVVAVLLASS
jgi:hypothetical protein